MSELLQRIKKELSQIEQEKDVKIVYACESGSRAWGFPSQDSDYDVRFIYIHKPNWYLSISKARDVIEKPICDSLDISGWELQKALCLFRKSNPPLLEWIGSPIVYLEQFSTVSDMRSIAHEYYSQNACTYHYLHMVNGNLKNYLCGSEVWVKKYFYVLRPLMAILWMEQGRGLVPTDFTVIVNNLDIPQLLREAINELIEEKKAGKELRRGPRNELISSFIETELERLVANKPAYPRPVSHKSKLDELFIKSLNQVWPGYLGVHLTNA
jgi:predicted nucleotidyltransferase